jgi:acyl carrier protein
MGIISVSQLQHNGKDLLARVAAGSEPFLITRYGQPVAALVPPLEAESDHLMIASPVPVRDVLRFTKRILARVEDRGVPVLITRHDVPIGLLVPVDPLDAERYLVAAAPRFLALRQRAETGPRVLTQALETVAAQIGSRPPVAHRAAGPRELVYEHIQRHLSKELGIEVERIQYASELVGNLDAGSLDLFELTMELEESYGVHMDAEDAAGISTVGDAVDFVVAYNAAPILRAESQRILRAFTGSRRSARRAVHEAYEQLPERAAALAGRGRQATLTLADLAAAGAQTADAAVTMVEPVLIALVDLVANPKTGTVTRDDFGRWMNAVGVIDEPDADWAFDAIDVHADGALPIEAFRRAVLDSQRGNLDVNLLGRSVLSIA